MNEVPIAVHRLDDVPSGSIRTLPDLYRTGVRMWSLLGQHPIVLLPKGALHPDLRYNESDVLRLVNTAIGGATPHTHEHPVCLVSTPTAKTSTLVFPLAESAKAIAEIAATAKWRSLFADLLRNDARTGNGTLMERCVDRLGKAAGTPSGDAQQRRMLQSGLNGLQFLLTNTETSAAATIYALVAEVQEQLASVAIPISGSESDCVVFDSRICHGRDVRRQTARTPDEGVYHLKLNPIA